MSSSPETSSFASLVSARARLDSRSRTVTRSRPPAAEVVTRIGFANVCTVKRAAMDKILGREEGCELHLLGRLSITDGILKE